MQRGGHGVVRTARKSAARLEGPRVTTAALVGGEHKEYGTAQTHEAVDGPEPGRAREAQHVVLNLDLSYLGSYSCTLY